MAVGEQISVEFTFCHIEGKHVSKVADYVRNAARIFLFGNGGSAANAIHIANDFWSCGLAAHALPAEVGTLTAIANDHGYEDVFAMMLKSHGRRGDLALALSGSGRSTNILKGLKVAREIGMRSVAIFGRFAEEAKDVEADLVVRIGSTMQAAEEAQIVLGHQVMHFLGRLR